MNDANKMQVIININAMRLKIGLPALNVDHQLKMDYDYLHEYQNGLIEHYNQALKNGPTEVMPVKKYNDRQTQRWREAYDKALAEGRHYSLLPQLGMYIFEKSFGYVAFHNSVALWAKTKKEVEKMMDDYTNKYLTRLESKL